MYFSDKETGQKDRISEDITIKVWNGIVSIFEEFKGKNYFSENFSEKCPDNGRVCGFVNSIFKGSRGSRGQSSTLNFLVLKQVQI